ncbi:hypothetical protein GPG95_004086 [Salmonella enterica]|nr:hypothetical protein [Salmonella enterica subsp. enterica serovar Montevideo]EGH0794885.1 hypothetical protein [Salmonella enterica subsp. enterica serovar Montevideo]EJT8386369.1 hypothetical protein [Salmonella enterica subsp. enterica serovar Montevideo]ELM0668175.1 hypothetical protein [Salmonella enterica subsp. enterica serovar Montevideo]
MKTREPGFRPGLLALALVMVWQSGHAQARDGTDFLSALGGVEVPSLVPSAPVTEATRPPAGPHPSAVREPEQKQEAVRTARALQENRRLKALLARQAQKLREQEAAVRRAEQARSQPELTPQLSALRRQLTQQASVLKTAEAARDSLAQEVKALRLKNHALSVKADVSSLTATPEPALSEALKQSREALARAEQQLTERSESLRQAQTQAATLTQSLAALRKQYDALSAERDSLREKAGGQQKQMADLTTQAEEARRKVDALTMQRDTLQKQRDEQSRQERHTDAVTQQKQAALNKQLADLKEAQAALRSQLAEAGQQNETLVKRMSAITAERDALQQSLATSEQRAAVLTQQVDTLKTGASPSPAGEDIVALHRQLAGAQQKNATLKAEGETATKQVSVLQEKVNTLTQQLAGLKAQQEKAAAVPDREKPALTTDAQRQTYASGVVFADNLKRTLALQKNLGITPDPALLLAGLTDAMQGAVRLREPDLDTSYRALIKRLASLEEKKYQEGEKALEKLASGPALLKRNRSVFFVQGRKGTGTIRPGDQVQFDMTESVVKGKVLRDTKGVKATLDDKLPYLVGQALTFAGRGGSVTVYCMASDVYPPEQLPPGLFAYSLLKYTFTVKGK